MLIATVVSFNFVSNVTLIVCQGLSNGNLFYDPNIHGTPLNLLQIPANVMQTIGAALQSGKEFFCRFTQDGKNVSDLGKILNVRDRTCVGEKDLEVKSVALIFDLLKESLNQIFSRSVGLVAVACLCSKLNRYLRIIRI